MILFFLFSLIIINFIGIFLFVISKRKERISSSKLHFDSDLNGRSLDLQIIKHLRDIIGFLFLTTVALGTVALFYNGYLGYGLIILLIFIISILLSSNLFRM